MPKIVYIEGYRNFKTKTCDHLYADPEEKDSCFSRITQDQGERDVCSLKKLLINVDTLVRAMKMV